MAGEVLEQLTGDLRTHEVITALSPNTAGDIAKAFVEATGKLKEFEGKVTTLETENSGLKTKFEGYIPKLTENATEEERNTFFKNLGRPDTPDGYELEAPKEGKMDESFAKTVKETFHKFGIPKDQAKALSTWWNEYNTEVGAKYLASLEAKRVEADTTLRKELGDKYDSTVKRVGEVWKKFSGEGQVDDSFLATMKLVPITDASDSNPVGNDARFIRWVMGVAKLVGEDTSPKGRPSGGIEMKEGLSYPNSPKS